VIRYLNTFYLNCSVTEAPPPKMFGYQDQGRVSVSEHLGGGASVAELSKSFQRLCHKTVVKVLSMQRLQPFAKHIYNI
jgi:hypothetical protein